MADSDPDVRWMTYSEAAAALGVNPESVAKRMRRSGWTRRPGNDGKPRVAVPVSALPVSVIVPVTVQNGASIVPVNNPDIPQSVQDNTLAVISAVFREEQDRLRAERDAAQTALAEARKRADWAEGELEGLKLATEHQHAELAQMRREVAEAHNRAVVAEQQVIEATRQREGAEVALAKARKWNFLNFLFNLEGKRRR